ncbi:hypothetical protein N7449_002168 [Penicillium cf. viridicatum]|uniref:FAD-binding PCMH-type domain-containing protein n=1 Tax=Penicillium cf. viridicatum TaxID=2972119 RepID=A0A9W9MUV7_9EURO|nr:hypothetical protein N7449_002168 [Penicillium cf. viridicatum]
MVRSSLQVLGCLLPLAIAFRLPSNGSSLCHQADSRFPGQVSYAGSSAYTSSQLDYYTGEERELNPGCIFTPTNTADVSAFVKLVASRDISTPKFAFRCGGHSFFAGAANIDKGVTVDLRSLNSFELSADQKTASVGGGSIWSNTVYTSLEEHNLTVAGGRIPGVGVGGFVTGGGLNYLGRRDGFSCDNVYGYEVVLASGKVVYASATSHRDLWLALKGGSNNFGIVTRFDLATHPQGQLLGGALVFNVTQKVLEDHATAFSNYMDPKNFDPLAEMEFNLVYHAGSWILSDALYYLNPEPTPTAYKEFFDIPGQVANTLIVANMTTVVTNSGVLVPSTVSRATQMNYSFKNANPAVYSQLFTTFQLAADKLYKVEGLVFDFLMQPIPVTNGTNSLGLEPNVKDLVLIDIGAAYYNAADDAVVQAAVQKIFDQHVHILKKAGIFLDWTYLNYAGSNQDPIGTYGDLATLRRVSKKYDSKGLFQTAVPGAFKLFK